MTFLNGKRETMSVAVIKKCLADIYVALSVASSDLLQGPLKPIFSENFWIDRAAPDVRVILINNLFCHFFTID